MFGHAIDGLARLGRQAMVALTWVLILVALALATLATVASGRAGELSGHGPGVAGAPAAQAPGWAQPALPD